MYKLFFNVVELLMRILRFLDFFNAEFRDICGFGEGNCCYLLKKNELLHNLKYL